MTKRSGYTSGIVTALAVVFAAVLAIMLVAATPALAHHKDGHDQGASKTSDEGSTQASPSEPDDNTDNRHPSGKDRETNNGPTDDTQGKSKSTPDQNGSGPERDYEGTDKPGGAGGMDKEDQDGNNGCGNDDDFEDDNEGWCGGKPARDNESGSVNDDVGSVDDDVTLGEFAARPLPEAPSVLGTRVARPLIRPAIAPKVVRGQRVRGGVLPFTGANALSLLLIGLGILASGVVTVTATRR